MNKLARLNDYWFVSKAYVIIENLYQWRINQSHKELSKIKHKKNLG